MPVVHVSRARLVLAALGVVGIPLGLWLMYGGPTWLRTGGGIIGVAAVFVMSTWRHAARH